MDEAQNNGVCYRDFCTWKNQKGIPTEKVEFTLPLIAAKKQDY